MTDPGHQISLLFDLFVAYQRVRRLVEVALAEAPLRGDEYAAYSLLFDEGPFTATEMSRAMGMPLTTVLDHLKTMDSRGHLSRDRHPRDGRAVHVSLTAAGVASFRRTNAAWEPMRKAFEEALALPKGDVRAAVQAIDDAARSSLEAAELSGSRRLA